MDLNTVTQVTEAYTKLTALGASAVNETLAYLIIQKGMNSLAIGLGFSVAAYQLFKLRKELVTVKKTSSTLLTSLFALMVFVIAGGCFYTYSGFEMVAKAAIGREYLIGTEVKSVNEIVENLKQFQNK